MATHTSPLLNESGTNTLEVMFDEMLLRELQQAMDSFWSTSRPQFSSGGVINHNRVGGFFEAIRSTGVMGPSMREQASAAEIHAALEASADESVRAAERVLEYRQMYPGNAFLTRAQVKALCLQYGLVMAPDFMFAGEIPEKNRAERAGFRLHEKHGEALLDGNDLASRLYARAMGTRYREIEFQPEVAAPESLDAHWALVVSDDVALLCPKGFMSLRMLAEVLNGRHLFDNEVFENVVPVVRTQKGFVRLHGRMIRHMEMSIERFRAEGFWAAAPLLETRLRCRFTLPDLTRPSKFSYADDVCQMVVCPPSMLHPNMPVQMNEGWECIFSQSQASPSGRGSDPIILQPVDGGYLVVTKWDAEALLPEVAGQTN